MRCGINKIKVLLHWLAYPFTLTTYFQKALERRDDIDLRTCGITTGRWQPYNGGMEMPLKYAVHPDVPLPFPLGTHQIDYSYVKAQLGNWKPDMVLTGDAGICWKERPSDGVVAHIATDPHVLNYDYPRTYSDKFFNMQEVYSKSGDIYLPYAFDPEYHCDLGLEREYDVAMIGLKYDKRENIVNRLRDRGLKVLYETGIVLDEYREINNKAKIGINQASLDDLNARAFEIPALGQIEIMTPVTDMQKPRHSYFKRAYVYNNTDEAVEQTLWCLNNLETAKEQLRLMRNEMKNETYEERVKFILKECGF